MFYSQMLLSKKGPLGTVWIAAHCHKRLKKDQVKQTDISSSVDKILLDEVPVVTYRILAFLLLGVVRIYSKKVEYLFHECQDVVSKLSDFKVRKRKDASIGGMLAPCHSITFPKRFELDAFDLEVTDQGVSDANVRFREDIMLADELSKESNTVDQLDKDHHRENIFFSEAYSSAHTPVRDVYSPQRVGRQSVVHPPKSVSTSAASMETFCTGFPKDHVCPMTFEGDENEQGHDGSSNEEHEILEEQPEHPTTRSNLQGKEVHNLTRSFLNPSQNMSTSVAGMEIFHGTGLFLEDRLCPMALEEDENEQCHDRPEEEHEMVEEQTECPMTMSNLQTKESHYLTRSFVNTSKSVSNSVAGTDIFFETELCVKDRLDPMALDEVENKQGHDKPSDEEQKTVREQMMHQTSILNLQLDEPHDVTSLFDKNVAVDAEHTRLPENIVVDTGNCQRMEECSKSIMVDVTPNSKDPGSSIPEIMAICTPAPKERGKVLKKRKCSFDDTIVVANNLFKQWIDDPSSLMCKRRKAPHTVLHARRAHILSNLPQSFFEPLYPCVSLDLRSLEHKKILPAEPIAAEEKPQSQVQAGSPTKSKFPEQTPIAPTTPVTHSASPTVHESRVANMSDPASSTRLVDKGPSPSEDLELNATLTAEETDLSAEIGQQNNTLSARTKTVARYLYGNFVRRKRCKEDVVVKLSQVLEGKNKKGSARLFYEILVLKTAKCIDVRQDNPYNDILLLETPVLWQVFEPEGVATL